MKLNLGIHLSVPNNLTNHKKIGNSLQLMFNKNKLTTDDIKSIKNILYSSILSMCIYTHHIK